MSCDLLRERAWNLRVAAVARLRSPARQLRGGGKSRTAPLGVQKSKRGPTLPETARRVGHPEEESGLFGLVGEREFGFFVEDEGTKETVGGAGAGDVDGNR